MGIIRITDLTLRAIIGTNAWERKKKQRVVINASFEYSAARAIATDNLQDTIDYKTITKRIIKEVTDSHFFLLEKLASRILTIVLNNKKVLRATVRVDKPYALRFAKSVSVTLSAKQKTKRIKAH